VLASTGKLAPSPTALLVLAFLFLTGALWAFGRLAVGEVIDNLELPTIGGGRERVLGTATANVFIFFKPDQEHSNSTLKQIAACERDFAGKSVHWVAIVSDRFPVEAVKAEVEEIGVKMPVLIDSGDQLYGKLGVALTPVIGIADKDHRLAAYQPFRKVNYAELIRARIRRLLGEITEAELQAVLNPEAVVEGSDPELARRRLKLAEKLFQSGSFEKAEQSARRSLEKDPTAAAHVLLGKILAAQGKRTEALEEFEAALKVDPANAEALAGKAARF
jgi:hypothetical protein